MMKHDNIVCECFREQVLIYMLILVLCTSTSCGHRIHKEENNVNSNKNVHVNEPSKAKPESIVNVALIDGYDVQIMKVVKEELKAHNIVCYIEGSIVYSVSVAQSDAPLARRILRCSKRINHARVQIIGESKRGRS